MRSRLPSRTEAWARLQAAAPPAWVLRHCRAVEALAVAMAEAAHRSGHAVDADLVARAAILHDIGRSVTQDVRHAGIGADLLRPDMPEALARAVETHTGAGIPPEEAHALGLPERDYMPRSLEERIVAHADNLYSGDKRLDLARIEAKYRDRGLDAAWRRIEALHQELCRELDADLETLEPARLADLPEAAADQGP